MRLASALARGGSLVARLGAASFDPLTSCCRAAAAALCLTTDTRPRGPDLLKRRPSHGMAVHQCVDAKQRGAPSLFSVPDRGLGPQMVWPAFHFPTPTIVYPLPRRVSELRLRRDAKG
jgi:hypothetical protein